MKRQKIKQITKLVKFIDFMVNVFRLCSIINSLYGQVAGDLETCSRLWRIISPRAEGGRGLGNLFTAVANHVGSGRHDSPQP